MQFYTSLNADISGTRRTVNSLLSSFAYTIISENKNFHFISTLNNDVINIRNLWVPKESWQKVPKVARPPFSYVTVMELRFPVWKPALGNGAFHLGNSDGTKVSSSETSAWQWLSITHSSSGIVFECH